MTSTTTATGAWTRAANVDLRFVLPARCERPELWRNLTPPEEGSALTLDEDGALRLDVRNIRFDHIWIANSGENTVSKLSTDTGQEEGRYRMPDGCGDPSRTTVDIEGNVWVGCRAGGSIVRIAAAERSCRDANNNGSIETSRDLNQNGQIDGAELLPQHRRVRARRRHRGLGG